MSTILRCEICSTFCTTPEALEKHKKTAVHKRNEEKGKDGNSEDKKAKVSTKGKSQTDKQNSSGKDSETKNEKPVESGKGDGGADKSKKADDLNRSRSSKRDSKDSTSHSRRSSRSGKSSDRIRSRSRDRHRGSSNDRSDRNRRSGYRSDSSRDRHSISSQSRDRRDSNRRQSTSEKSRRHGDRKDDDDADLSELFFSGEWEVTDEVVDDEMDIDESSKGDNTKSIPNVGSDKKDNPVVVSGDKDKATLTGDKKDISTISDKKDSSSIASDKKTPENKGNNAEVNDNGLEEISDVATEDEEMNERKSVMSMEDEMSSKDQKTASAEKKKLMSGKPVSRKEADVKKIEEKDKEDLGEEFVSSRMTPHSKHATQTNKNFSTFRDSSNVIKALNKNLTEVTVVVKKLDAKKLSSNLKISASDFAIMSESKENVDLISQQILESVVKQVSQQERPKKAPVKQSQPKKVSVKEVELQSTSMKQAASNVAASNDIANKTKDSHSKNLKNYRIPKLSEKKNVIKDKGKTDGKVKKYRRIIRGRESAVSDGRADKKISKSSDDKASKKIDKPDKKNLKPTDTKRREERNRKTEMADLRSVDRRKSRSKSPFHRRFHRDSSHERVRYNRSRSPIRRDRKWNVDGEMRRNEGRSRLDFHTRRHSHDRSRDRSLDRSQDRSYDRSRSPFRQRRSTSPNDRKQFRISPERNRPHIERDIEDNFQTQPNQPSFQNFASGIGQSYPPPPVQFENYQKPPDSNYYVEFNTGNPQITPFNPGQYTVGFQQTVVSQQSMKSATALSNQNQFHNKPNRERVLRPVQRATNEEMTIAEAEMAGNASKVSVRFPEQGGGQLQQNKKNAFQGNRNMNANVRNFAFQDNANEMNFSQNSFNVHQNLQSNLNKLPPNANSMLSSNKTDTKDDAVRSMIREALSVRMLELARSQNPAGAGLKTSQYNQPVSFSVQDSGSDLNIPMQDSFPNVVQNVDCAPNYNEYSNQAWSSVQERVPSSSSVHYDSRTSANIKDNRLQSFKEQKPNIPSLLNPIEKVQIAEQLSAVLASMGNTNVSEDMLSRLVQQAITSKVSGDPSTSIQQQQASYSYTRGNLEKSHAENTNLGRNSRRVSVSFDESKQLPSEIKSSVSFDRSNPLYGRSGNTVSFDRSGNTVSFGGMGNTVSFDRSDNYSRSGNVSFERPGTTVHYERLSMPGNTVSFDRSDSSVSMSRLGPTASFQKSSNAISFDRPANTVSFDRSSNSTNLSALDSRSRKSRFEQSATTTTFNYAGSSSPQSLIMPQLSVSLGSSGNLHLNSAASVQFKSASGLSSNSLKNSGGNWQSNQQSGLLNLGQKLGNINKGTQKMQSDILISYPIGNFRSMTGNQGSKSSVNMNDSMMGFGNSEETGNNIGRMQNQMNSSYSSSQKRSGESGVMSWNQPTSGRYGY